MTTEYSDVNVECFGSESLLDERSSRVLDHPGLFLTVQQSLIWLNISLKTYNAIPSHKT